METFSLKSVVTYCPLMLQKQPRLMILVLWAGHWAWWPVEWYWPLTTALTDLTWNQISHSLTTDDSKESPVSVMQCEVKVLSSTKQKIEPKYFSLGGLYCNKTRSFCLIKLSFVSVCHLWYFHTVSTPVPISCTGVQFGNLNLQATTRVSGLSSWAVTCQHYWWDFDQNNLR